jgi:hypothetical protein
VPSEQVTFEVEHAPGGVVRKPQPSVAIDNQYAFDHARQDGRHTRTIVFQFA